MQPPFKPRIRDRLDVSNFDRQFTSQKVELSPTDESFMMNMDQSMFDGFSYTSETFKYPFNEEEQDIIIDHDHLCAIEKKQQEEENQQSSSGAIQKQAQLNLDSAGDEEEERGDQEEHPDANHNYYQNNKNKRAT